MEKVSVIGIGKLGLCFALTLEKSGYNVVGVDIVEDYVKSINDKRLVTSEPGVREHLRASKNFRATVDIREAVEHSDILFVVVATPSLSNGGYDHSQIDSVVEKLSSSGRQARTKHLIICATVMPGYTDKITERLKGEGFVASYNPEFIAQGSILRDQQSPDLVLIGEGNENIGDTLENIYNNICVNSPSIKRMSPLSAEICKISLNCFLTTKIAFANMIGDLAVTAGAQADKVLEAIGTDTRVGNKCLRYGFGYGGPCLPRDNRALMAYAEEKDVKVPISVASDESNFLHLKFQVEKFLKDTDKEEDVIIEQVTYKPGTVILEESQELKFAVEIAEKGYKVIIRESKEVIDNVRSLYGDLFEYQVRDRQHQHAA